MNPAQFLLIWCIRGYRLLLSPWLGASCRFEPTCSVYAIQAVEKHGAIYGSYLMIKRLLRCHPFCQGGHDPIPQKRSKLWHTITSLHDCTYHKTTEPHQAD